MITLQDISELVLDWQAGDLRLVDLYDRCLDLLEYHDVDAVLALLPPELRSDFAARMRNDFDNETPSEDYIWFDSGRGDHPGKCVIIERIRAWLADPSREATEP